jgi:TetR/AcrR family transcriptional regulator
LDKKRIDKNAELAILEAAKRVFTEKGFAGARMDEIAKAAGINRALLHYYFRSKEKLFELIFEERIKEFFGGLAKIVFSPISLSEKIRAIVTHNITMVQQNPHLPIFVMQEIARNPQRLIQFSEKASVKPGLIYQSFTAQVNAEIKNGKIKKTDPGQLLINTMSMAIYPFIARPMIMNLQQIDAPGFEKLMERRKNEVAEFILDALKP